MPSKNVLCILTPCNSERKSPQFLLSVMSLCHTMAFWKMSYLSSFNGLHTDRPMRMFTEGLQDYIILGSENPQL